MSRKTLGKTFGRRGHEIDTVKDQVRRLMIQYPLTRDNDLLLIFTYLEKHMGLKMPPLEQRHLNYGGICGTIMRVRRTIQNTDKVLLPNSAEVRRQRRIKEEDFREWARRQKKE
ncbi:MAG: hypothetical protein ACTSPB_01325 [Candidatus Thorarchaeota archaeon]